MSDATASGEDQIACTENAECSGLDKSYCDSGKNLCVCPVDHPIIDLVNGYCVAEAKLDTGCKFDSECDAADEFSYCGKSVGKCVCKEGYSMEEYPDVGYSCVRTDPNQGPGTVDPAMIGVLVGLALMFVIICVVLRLFSKARFRENRSIFNTPNPRLMNASLFKDSGVAGRRGSAMSTVSATGSAHLTGGAAPKTPSPGKETKKKSETTVAIENVD